LADALAVTDAEKPLLHGLLQGIVDDPQRRHIFDDPCAGRVEPRASFAGCRVLQIAQPVPHQPPDIQLVAQDAGAALMVAADRGIAPRTATWTGNTLLVQLVRDRARALTAAEEFKDAGDRRRLCLVDGAAAMDRVAARVGLANDIVAEAQPAARPT